MSTYFSLPITVELQSVTLKTSLVVAPTDSIQRILFHVHHTYGVTLEELEIKGSPVNGIVSHCDKAGVTVTNIWEAFEVIPIQVEVKYSEKSIEETVIIPDFKTTWEVRRLIDRVEHSLKLYGVTGLNEWSIQYNGMDISDSLIQDYIGSPNPVVTMTPVVKNNVRAHVVNPRGEIISSYTINVNDVSAQNIETAVRTETGLTSANVIFTYKAVIGQGAISMLCEDMTTGNYDHEELTVIRI